MAEPVCLSDFEDVARAILPKPTFDYYASSAMHGDGYRRSLLEFSQWHILPRVLSLTKPVRLDHSFLGHQKVASPIAIAPSAMQAMAHPDGECATATACEKTQSCMVLSTYSTKSLEDVKAQTSSRTPLWFQVYMMKQRDLTKALIQRAEKAGYSAIVLTVDVPYLGRRLLNIRNKFKLTPPHHLANFDPSLGIKTASESSAQQNKSVEGEASLQWQRDIEWLKSITKLPIILKGIMTAEDAHLALRYQVGGIIVSHHGGRQLESTLAPIEVLEEIVGAVQGRMDVFVDGGFRCGADIFKALCLGAKGVFIGRPTLWALAYNGAEGVEKMLEILQQELKTTMALCGVDNIGQLSPRFLKRRHSSQCSL